MLHVRPVGEGGTQGDPLPVTCERDVFDYLDMKYLEPVDR
jgi:DNA polymerase beta